MRRIRQDVEAASAIEPVSAAERWGFAARRAGTHSLLIWPPLTLAWLFVVGLRKHAMAFDFMHAYLPAATAVLAGHSPYPPATIAAVSPRTAFVYPPLTAYLAAPLTIVSPTVAEAVASALAVALVIAILRVAGVRDWRCYMVVLLWVPTYSALQTANVSLLLALGLALVWRFRERTWAVALLAGFLVALKLFMWPVFAWLLVTRRFRAAVGGAAAAVALAFGPWALIGFAGLGKYPHLLSLLSKVEERDGYTIAAFLSGGLSWRVASAVGLAVGLAVLAALWRRRDDECTAFALAIAAALCLSPIVSMHYFIVLFVVLGLFVPRFGWPWVLPLLLWIAPQVGNGAAWQTAAALAIVAATFGVALRRSARDAATAPAAGPATA